MGCLSCGNDSPIARATTINLVAFGVLTALAAVTTIVVLSTLGYAYLYKAMGLVTGVSSSGLKTCLAISKWSAVGCGGALFLGITPKVAQKLINNCHCGKRSSFEPRNQINIPVQSMHGDPGGSY